MRVLAPSTTVIVCSHMKPYLRDELVSLVTQTRLDIQIIVADSGQWINRMDHDPVALAMAGIYEEFYRHPLVEWVTTGELPGLIERKCPVGWATNEVIRAGLIRGRYVCMGYDDDVHHRTFVERMAGRLDETGGAAVWCSQERLHVTHGGSRFSRAGEIRAYGPKYGAQFDQVVDGTQVMFRRELLDRIGDPWLTEDPADAVCRHSDGIFLDKIGVLAGAVDNIDEVLVVHRFTELSTYSPSRVKRR